jgi:hypothetical protein
MVAMPKCCTGGRISAMPHGARRKPDGETAATATPAGPAVCGGRKSPLVNARGGVISNCQRLPLLAKATTAAASKRGRGHVLLGNADVSKR